LYQQNPTADLEAEIAEEKRSMAKFDTLFADIQKQLGLTGRYDPASIDFSCLSGAINVIEVGCGRLSDYALQYVKFLADYCSRGGRAASFQPMVKADCQ